VTKVRRRCPPHPDEEEQPTSAVGALAGVLDVATPENLSTSYDLLKLLGMVVGQITLLDIATGSADAKARTSAARALAGLKESPNEIAERLKAGPFAGLTTGDLRTVVEQIRQGKDPKQVLQLVVDEKRRKETA